MANQILTPAHEYGLSLLQNQQQPRTFAEGFSKPIIMALLMRKAKQEEEARNQGMADALLQFQSNVQNESLPTINMSAPAMSRVQPGEDTSLRDYGAVNQMPSRADAMANALQGIKNPDFVNAMAPGIMEAQANQANSDADRQARMAEILMGARINQGQQERQNQFATSERMGGQEFGGQQATQAQASSERVAQANRDAAAQQAQLNRDATAQQNQLNRQTTLDAATIRRGSRFLPASAASLESDDISAVQIANNIEADLGAIGQQIADGQLNLSLVGNAVSRGRNYLGMSTENSRNFATFKATMERLRNDSLRLNKGVQTEGDSIRAWNELFANLNDEQVVAQRIQEIQAINKRAAAQRLQQIQIRRETFGVDQLDESQFQSAPAINANGPQVSGGFKYLGTE